MILRDRLEDLSIYYWLRDLFENSPYGNLLSFVTIEDGYPDKEIEVPSVVIVNDQINLIPFEHGNRKHNRGRVWSISIIANNKTQRDDFSTYIADELEDGIPVYDYNLGFPPTVTTQIDLLRPMNMIIRPVRIFPELVEKLYYRSTITFYTERLGG